MKETIIGYLILIALVTSLIFMVRLVPSSLLKERLLGTKEKEVQVDTIESKLKAANDQLNMFYLLQKVKKDIPKKTFDQEDNLKIQELQQSSDPSNINALLMGEYLTAEGETTFIGDIWICMTITNGSKYTFQPPIVITVNIKDESNGIDIAIPLVDASLVSDVKKNWAPGETRTLSATIDLEDQSGFYDYLTKTLKLPANELMSIVKHVKISFEDIIPFRDQ